MVWRPILKENKKLKKEWFQNFLYRPVAGSLTLTGSGTKSYPGPYPSLLYLHSERGSRLRKSETVNGNHSIVSLLIKLCFLFWFLLFWFLLSLFFSVALMKASCWVYLFLNQKYLKFGSNCLITLVTSSTCFFDPNDLSIASTKTKY